MSAPVKSDTTPHAGGRDPDKRFYGRRHGKKLSPRQAGLMAARLPQLRLSPDGIAADPLPAESAESGERWAAAQAAPALFLEVGFGGGEHLAAQARARPTAHFIGCEPFHNGVAKLLTQIEEGGLDNISVYPDDVRDLLPALPAASFDGVFVLFPDPWPKARHNKRRIIAPDTVASFARILKPGGFLRFASDIDDYIDWALRRISAPPHFTWTANAPADWRIRPADWPETRYERKAKREGRPCAYLHFTRTAASATTATRTAETA